ncbi:MAG TPA: DUF3465 domain-containing protein [Trichormus sp.]|jgi:hypothetical protein
MAKTNRKLANHLMLLVSFCLTLLLHSCRSIAPPSALTDRGRTATDAELAKGRGFDDLDGIRAQDGHLFKVEVTVKAPVKELLPDDTEGVPHQRFLIELSNGTTLLIAHDTAIAPHVPLEPGDTPIIRGEFIWNQRGGVIHFTHHPARPGHEGGFIYVNGKRYE